MRKAHGLSGIIVCVTIAALFLMGTVPSFGAEKEIYPTIDPTSEDAPKINARSAIVIESGSGTVVYEKNADVVREPASVTKILNCLVVLETLDMDQEVTVPKGIDLTGSIIGLMKGEKFTVEQLVYGMMLESGNDAAQMLAITAGGTEEEFCEMMNERAKACGAEHTDFRNPNGLNDDPDKLNKTTASDLALIAAEAMRNETFREVVSTKKYTIPATSKTPVRKLKNTNLCLWENTKIALEDGTEIDLGYEGCNGIKTGFTTTAGSCYAGSAKRDDMEYIVIILDADDDTTRFTDAIKLWDYAFDHFQREVIVSAGHVIGAQGVKKGSVRKVDIAPKRDLTIMMPKDEELLEGITTEIVLDKTKVEAPVEEGTAVGKVYAYDSSFRPIGVQTLYTTASVAEGGPLSVIGIADNEAPWVIGGAAVLLLLIILGAIKGRRGRKKNRKGQQEDMRTELVKMRSAGVGMTPAEWSEVTGEPADVPIPQGPARLTEEEYEAINAPEITRSEKLPAGKPVAPKTPAPPDPNQPRRHGRMTAQELEDLLAGRIVQRKDDLDDPLDRN